MHSIDSKAAARRSVGATEATKATPSKPDQALHRGLTTSAPMAAWRRWQWAGVTALLSACSSPMPPHAPAAPQRPPVAPSTDAAAQRPGSSSAAPSTTPRTDAAAPRLTPARDARSWAEFRRQAGERLVAAHPNTSYTGTVPETLLAIPVLEVELHADGSVRRIDVLRHPRQARDTTQLAIDAVKRAAPYGNMHHLPKPWRFSETFLFDDDRRFKPRSLD